MCMGESRMTDSEASEQDFVPSAVLVGGMIGKRKAGIQF